MQHNVAVWAATFDAKGERVVTASSDNTARIWDARTDEPIGKPLHHDGWVLAATFDAKGERVVTASFDNTARIDRASWNACTNISRPMPASTRASCKTSGAAHQRQFSST